MSTDLIKEANEILDLEQNIPERHSYFQLKYFNIGKEYTIQGRLWQCIREIRVRVRNLNALDLEIEETYDKIELLEIKLERFKIGKQKLEKDACEEIHQLDQKEFNIRTRQIERKIEAINKSLPELTNRKQNQIDELNFFIQEFNTLNTIEPVRPLDDIESQKQYWNEKIGLHVTLSSLLQKPLDIDLVQTAMSLPDDSVIKKEIAKMLENNQKLLVQARNKSLENFDKPKE